VALSAARLADFMAADLSALDLLWSKSTGCISATISCWSPAIGVDGEGNKHPLALVEGATENAATVQALLDNLVSRGLARQCQDCSSSTARKRCRRRSAAPSVRPPRSSAVRSTKRATSWKRLPKEHHAATRRVLRQAWELDDADKAEKLIRNLARRLGPAMARRSGQHPRRPRRIPDCRPVEAAEGACVDRSPVPTSPRT